METYFFWNFRHIPTTLDRLEFAPQFAQNCPLSWAEKKHWGGKTKRWLFRIRWLETNFKVKFRDWKGFGICKAQWCTSVSSGLCKGCILFWPTKWNRHVMKLICKFDCHAKIHKPTTKIIILKKPNLEKRFWKEEEFLFSRVFGTFLKKYSLEFFNYFV